MRIRVAALTVTVEKARKEGPVPEGFLTGHEGLPATEPRAGPVRVLIAAGGTGGHIFPALAVAEELRARTKREREPQAQAGTSVESDIQFLGTRRGLESRLIPAAGFNLRTIEATGLKGIGGWRKVRNLLVLPRTAVETAQVLREFQPDVVVGLGGYLAGPVMLEAAVKDIPTVLFEPNALPGFTNRVLAPVVRLAAVGFEEAAAFYGTKARLTGHPVRKAFYRIPAKEHRPPYTVLVLGGSQGSKTINAAVIKTAELISSQGLNWAIIHQTGERDFDAVQKAYRELGFGAEVCAFIEDVPQAFARTDVVVCRAGAMTVAELAAAGKAAVLIPFPEAADQHQRANALVLVRMGAARLIEQHELTPDRLLGEIESLLRDPKELAAAEQRGCSLARPDAAERIADLVEGLAE